MKYEIWIRNIKRWEVAGKDREGWEIIKDIEKCDLLKVICWKLEIELEISYRAKTD